jgi:phytoene synthase
MQDPPYCLGLLKQGDPDRYLACLFSPDQHRWALAALYAFNLEIARTAEIVSDPLIGDIRLQWWRDVLRGERRGEALAHPVAAPLLAAIERYRLPINPLENLIEARSFDLYHDPMGPLTVLEGYCGETASVLFRLACLVLADGGPLGNADLAGHAGVAYGITGILKNIPWHSARGQIFLPSDTLEVNKATASDIRAKRSTPEVLASLTDLRRIVRGHLETVRSLFSHESENTYPAFLPLVTVAPSIRSMESKSYQPFKTVIAPNPILNLYRYWRAAKTRRI